jgi:hypothetical protein
MLATLSRTASRLQPLRPALGIALGALALAVAIAIFNPDLSGLQRALPALVAALLWVICALVFVQVFATVPAPPEPELRGLGRLVRRLNRGFHWLLFALFALITAAAVLITIRLVSDLL